MFDSLPNLISQSNWIGPFLLRVSLCALMILIVRRVLAYRWGAQIRRLLWMILIIRCLVPWSQPIPYHPTGLLEFNETHGTRTAPGPSPAPSDTYTYSEPIHTVQPASVSLAPQGNGPVVKRPFEYGMPILIGLWIMGVLAVLIVTLYQYRRMIRRATAQTVPAPAWVQDIFLACRDRLRIRRWPALIISPHITSPCLAGAFRPRILLPSQLLEDTSEQEMQHILLHECIHHQQRDIWYAWLWTLTLAIHWFNPLLWWAGRRLSQDCEAACDERVLAVLEPDKRISYGQSLLALAQRLRPVAKTRPGFSCILEHTNRLTRRLTMIKNYHHRRHVPVIGKLVLILFAVLVLTSYAGQQLKAPINAEKAELMGRVEDLFLRNFRDVSLRKSLEWGPVKTNDRGHRSIRYTYEALFRNQEQKTINQVFTFDEKGRYLGRKTLKIPSKEEMHPLVRNFVTVRKDGGPTWRKASAIKNNTWHIGHFSRRRDERWYRLEVSTDVTYAFFVDAESGSGTYSADPVIEIYEDKVDPSTRVILDFRRRYYRIPLGYRPQSNGTAYIRIISHNPHTTSFAVACTELPGEDKEYDPTFLTMGSASPLVEDNRSARFLFEDNGLDYQPIRTPTEFENKKFKLPFLGLAKDETSLYIKLVYDSPIIARFGVRLAGDTYGLKQYIPFGTLIGKNLRIIQLELEKAATYPTHICVEIGDGHSVVIKKEIVDDFLK